MKEFDDAQIPDCLRFQNKNAYYHERLGKLAQFLIPRGRRVLDLGCGTGDLLELLEPSYGVGMDISPGMIEFAKARHPRLHFVVGDMEELTLVEEGFDYIVLSNTIGYLRDIQRFLSQLKRYVKPETRLVIIHYNFLWEPVLKLAERLGLKMKEPLLNWLSSGDLETLLALEGFETVKKKQDMLLPKRIPFLSGLVNRFFAQLPLLRSLALVQAVVARPRPAPRDRAMTCSVIVPARNERGNIEALVQRIPCMGSHTEIIFVEGHSTDGTAEELRRIAAAHPERDITVLTQDGEGKADAVRKGFERARGEILMILDADLTVRPEDLSKFYQAVCSGTAELAIGNRLVYPLQKESMRLLNMAGNKFFSMAFTFLLDQRIKDTLCGAKALSRMYYLAISENRSYFGCFDPFGDFDLIFGAAKMNLRIAEIPVRYHARAYGETQISRFRHGLLLLRMVFMAVRKFKFS